MKRVRKFAIAAAVLAAIFTMPILAVALPTVKASTAITATPNLAKRTKSNSGSTYADIQDQYDYEAYPGGPLTHVYANSTAQTGSFSMQTSCQAKGGGMGVMCDLYTTFTDTVTVNFSGPNPSLDKLVKYIIGVNGTTDGEGEWRGGDIYLRIIIRNIGTASKLKNIYAELGYEKGWGLNLVGERYTLPQNDAKVDHKDRLQITATQNLKSFAHSMDGKYTFDVALYHKTTHLYIDPLTPGLSLTSESGHDYRTPKTAVEASTWALYE